jgi:hypothetical protein
MTAKPGGTAGNVSRPVLWDGFIFLSAGEKNGRRERAARTGRCAGKGT